MPARINLDPEINGGKPIVTGTRISIQTVLGHLSAGDEIGDVLACLEYGELGSPNRLPPVPSPRNTPRACAPAPIP